MSVPSIRTSPAVGSISRFSMRTSVDLPEPDRPITTKISPASTLTDTSCTPTVMPVSARLASLLCPSASSRRADRKSVVEGKRVLVRVDLGGLRILKKKQGDYYIETY